MTLGYEILSLKTHMVTRGHPKKIETELFPVIELHFNIFYNDKLTVRVLNQRLAQIKEVEVHHPHNTRMIKRLKDTI